MTADLEPFLLADRPCCDNCKGWGVYNAGLFDDHELNLPDHGYIERCDICRIMTDTEAIILARLDGYKVDNNGWVLEPPPTKETA